MSYLRLVISLTDAVLRRGQASHICVRKLYHNRSETACLRFGVPSNHYLNQYWLIFNMTLKNKVQWNSNLIWTSFNTEDWFENFVCNILPSCLGLHVLNGLLFVFRTLDKYKATLIPAYISNCIHYIAWYEITYPSQKQTMRPLMFGNW